MTFDEFCDEIDRIAKDEYGFVGKPITIQTGRECWRHYYINNESPKYAFLEDMSNA